MNTNLSAWQMFLALHFFFWVQHPETTEKNNIAFLDELFILIFG